MGRYRFREGRPYGARLMRVVERPIENSPYADLHLLRLEFEVFDIDEARQHLRSTGAVACRDLVVGKHVDASMDSSLIAYAKAMSLAKPEVTAEWLRLNQHRPWIKVVFGSVGKTDLRNEFRMFVKLDPHGWSVVEYPFDLDKDWVTVSEASRNLRTSESTVRRRVAELEPKWGERLIRRTKGNHRRIKLSLLRNLWPE